MKRSPSRPSPVTVTPGRKPYRTTFVTVALPPAARAELAALLRELSDSGLGALPLDVVALRPERGDPLAAGHVVGYACAALRAQIRSTK